MHINQMRYFVTLCNCGSFSKAAELLFISQPAISKQITALEQELGVQLLERRKGVKVQITRSGELYYQTFHQILENLEETAFKTKYTSPATKRIYKIGIMEGWMMHNYIHICNKDLSQVFTDVELNFEFLSPSRLNILKDNGQLDFILLIDPAFENTKDYIKEPIACIHSLLYTAINHPAVENGMINLKKLDPHIYILSGREVIHINLPQIKTLLYPSVPIFKEVMSINSILMNVLSGNGSAIADEWSIPRYSDRFSAFVLSSTEIPVVFARKNVEDSSFYLMYQYLLDKFQKWVDEIPPLTH